MRTKGKLLILLLGLLLLQHPNACRAQESGELVFGMSAAFSGASRGLGIEYYRGVSAWLNNVNELGGVHGRKLRVIAYDDGYDPIPTIRNTIRLVRDDHVFALFSYIGTPTATRILPLLKRFKNEHVYLLFPLSGAQPLREPPYGSYVYNLRASYFEETRGLVQHFTALGRKRVAVFYQADAYGRNGWDGVRRALADEGLSIVSEAAYRRGARFSADFSAEVELLKQGDPDAVITVGSYAATAAFIRDARDKGLDVPVATVSFSDSDNMLRLLDAVGKRVGRDYTHDLVCSQVVPSYEDLELPVVRLYREMMDKFAQMPPDSLLREPYMPHRYSFVSLEGFLNAMLLVRMVENLGPDPSPERIPEAMAALGGESLGLDHPLLFSGQCRQGLNEVYYVTVDEGRFVPIQDWSRWSK
jgi:ABC-type branched-subunit amino acid transport system substrate-binding protein